MKKSRLSSCTVTMVVLTILSEAAASGSRLDLSPDGRQLAYVWQGSLAISPVEGPTAEVIPQSTGAEYVQWSPTGRHLATVTKAGGRTELKLYSAAEKKTRGIGGNLRAPFAWREDGNRFACVHDLPDGGSEIVWYNLAENGVSFRAALPMAVTAGAPMVWLPSTDDLAFVATDHNVYTVEAGEFKKVTTSGDVLGMNLYAGGKKLIWARRGPNLHYILMSVYAFDLTSRMVERLGFPERVAALNPNPRSAPDSIDRVELSPDGVRLLIYANLSSSKAKSRALYTVSMDGRSARQIQRSTAPASETIDAAWSRDGKTICVQFVSAAGHKLFTTAADGTGGRIVRAETTH